MSHSRTYRSPIARLLVPLVIAGVASACSGAASSGSGAYAPPSSQSPSAVSSSSTASAVPASSASSAGAPSSGNVTIGVATSGSLGTYLTAPDGKTLYTLSSDPTNKSTCAGDCATAWPPLLIAAGGKVAQPTTVMGTFGTITRDDGTSQVALDGHPLYEFVKDTAPGQTNGEGIVAFGGTWHVAKAA